MQTTGRQVIYTDVETITYENVIEVLRDSLSKHTENANTIDFLLKYEKGIQPLQRVKTTRTDIDIQCIDNVASEIANFKISYHWSNPITLVQRGDKDTGFEEEGKGIALLNECYSEIGIKKKTIELARYVEICGVGYTFVDINTDFDETESYFTVDVLDPRNCFVVRSSRHTDKRIMMAVTFSVDKQNVKHFTCFTKDYRFEIVNYEHTEHSGELNPLRMIPIVEWIRNYDLMGCFERCIDDMDTLNIMQSDFANDVDQNTNTIWHANDVEFPKKIVTDENGNETEVIVKPETGDWIESYTTDGGKAPFIKPLAVNYDYNGIMNNVVQKRAWILQKCNVPQRNDNSGGSTGIAMSDATGWSNAEVEASMLQEIMEDCKMQEVKLALKAISKAPHIAEEYLPLLLLRAKDIRPNIKRQKTYEMSTKINTLCTGLAHGIDFASLVKEINFFSDPQQVIEDSKETVKMYQMSVFGQDNSGTTEDAPNKDRIMQDESDQVNNSPMIDKSRA